MNIAIPFKKIKSGFSGGLALLLAVICLTGGTEKAAGREVAQTIPVVMISIDGLRPDYVLDAERLGWKLPNLTALAKEGAYATGVAGITPTVTYPSHTTLITGTSPARHGIPANTPFDPFGSNLGGWYWYAEDIRVETLWGAAGRAGRVTASIDWPVSVGADVRHNIVQFWRAKTDDDHKLTRALSTPGLVAEAERDCGTFPGAYNYDLDGDIRRARFMVWMLEKKRPGLMTGYFSSLDEEQHNTGPYTAKTRTTLERIDSLVGDVRRAAGGQAILAIVSDHGHVLSDNELHLNSAFRDEGLLELDGQGRLKSWRAYAWSNSGSAAVMVRDPGDRDAGEKARALLSSLQRDPASGIDEVAEGDRAVALGGFPGAAFIVGMKAGHRVGGALTGPVSRKGKPGGTHGYLPTVREMDASFFIAGPGIPSGRNLGRIDMRDIAPTLAALMDFELPSAEGRNLFVRQ